MIEIKGKEYELKYPVHTLCLMADDGIDVFNMENMKINISTIRDLFYYGLKYENKKITKNQTEEIMDEYLEEHTIKELIGLVMASLGKSMGGKKTEDNVADDESNGEGKQ